MLKATFKKIVYLISHIIITLRFSILSIFITLFLIGSILLITISYKGSSDNILFTANKAMEDHTELVNQLFKSEIYIAERDAKLTTSLIVRNILNINDTNQMVQYFYSLAEQFNIVQAVYWGDIKGNYISAEYEDDDSITSNVIDPTKQIESGIKRDVKGNILKLTHSKSNYDPRNRPWYQEAMTKQRAVWTDVYLYQPTEYLGITYATPIYNENHELKGVIGVDIRLDWISWYINTLKLTPNGMLFVLQDDGKIVGFPNFDKLPKQNKLIDIHDVTFPWIAKSFDIYKKDKNPLFSFTYNGTSYLATYRPAPMLAHRGWLIGMVAPKKDFIGDLRKARSTNLMLSLIILMIGILLISRFVNGIIKPVKALINETSKIKEFDLDEHEKVFSRIKEIILLSEAIATMKTGLRAFKRYVPSDLVKQLIKKGENTRLGGDKKTLVAFFSDIKDFTTIAHQAEPNQLMVQLNEYFEILADVIISEKGTIDKYIGDAIMAFWGGAG